MFFSFSISSSSSSSSSSSFLFSPASSSLSPLHHHCRQAGSPNRKEASVFASQSPPCAAPPRFPVPRSPPAGWSPMPITIRTRIRIGNLAALPCVPPSSLLHSSPLLSCGLRAAGMGIHIRIQTGRRVRVPRQVNSGQFRSGQQVSRPGQ